MQNKKSIPVKPNILIVTFFILFFCVGLCIFKDHGVGWDEGNNRHYGYLVLNHVTGHNLIPKHSPSSFHDPEALGDTFDEHFAKVHGPVFEVLLVSLEIFLNAKDLREIYLLRHLAGFIIFFIGSFFFFLLCRHIFNNWKIGLLGSLFLILSPRIFAHSFYNSSDIPLLSMSIICMYTLIKYLENKNMLWAIFHAIACAIMIDTRIVGIIMPFLTFSFIILDMCMSYDKNSYIKKVALSLFVYFLLLGVLVILFWPILWKIPVENFINAFKESSNDPWGWWELYFGKQTFGQKVPWHFTPVWMFITTPPLYALCFLLGLFSLIRPIKNFKKFYAKKKPELAALICFSLPLIVVTILRPTLYNGWRHTFFIYPGFLIVSLSGVSFALGFIKKRFKEMTYNIAITVLVLPIMFSLLITTSFMVRSHPHQNVYFNIFVGGLQNAKGNFEMGYWGTEFREGLEYILKHDSREKINIYLSWDPIRFNSAILKPSERKRIKFTLKAEEADYFLYNYYNLPVKFSPDYLGYGEPTKHAFKEVWSRKIDGVKILTVYRSAS